MICIWCANHLGAAVSACPQCGVSAALSRDDAFREGLRSLQVVAERAWYRHPLRWVAGGALFLVDAGLLLAVSPDLPLPALAALVTSLLVSNVLAGSAILHALDRDARLARAAMTRLRNEAGVPLETCAACAGSRRRRAASPIAVATREIDPEVHNFVSDPTDYKGVAACVPCHGTGLVPRPAAAAAR